jgi:acetyltransferase-like isoleucine patch superfamily enzyme
VPDVLIHEGMRADPSAILGYPPSRRCESPLRIGADAQIRSGSTIYAGSEIGARFQTGHNVVVREECVIGDDVSIWSNTVVDHGCRIGDRVKIHSNCYIAQYTDIAEDAFLAPGVCIANDRYPGRGDSADVMSGPSIGAGAQIGVNATLLPYVRVGAKSLIGAGAVVVLDIPPGAIAFGNPAAVRGWIDELTAVEQRVEAVTDSAGRFRRSGRRKPSHLHQIGDGE